VRARSIFDNIQTKMPTTYVFMYGFVERDLSDIELPSDYEITDNKRRAHFVLFATDPKKQLRRLPPRNGFGGTREDIIENIRKYMGIE